MDLIIYHCHEKHKLLSEANNELIFHTILYLHQIFNDKGRNCHQTKGWRLSLYRAWGQVQSTSAPNLPLAKIVANVFQLIRLSSSIHNFYHNLFITVYVIFEEGVCYGQDGSQNFHFYKCYDICFYDFCNKRLLMGKTVLKF